MLSIIADGSRIRLFVEHTVLLERGDSYRKFLGKAAQLVTEAVGMPAQREPKPMVGVPAAVNGEQPSAVAAWL